MEKFDAEPDTVLLLAERVSDAQRLATMQIKESDAAGGGRKGSKRKGGGGEDEEGGMGRMEGMGRGRGHGGAGRGKKGKR